MSTLVTILLAAVLELLSPSKSNSAENSSTFAKSEAILEHEKNLSGTHAAYVKLKNKTC